MTMLCILYILATNGCLVPNFLVAFARQNYRSNIAR